jgi:hypothetical protein
MGAGTKQMTRTRDVSLDHCNYDYDSSYALFDPQEAGGHHSCVRQPVLGRTWWSQPPATMSVSLRSWRGELSELGESVCCAPAGTGSHGPILARRGVGASGAGMGRGCDTFSGPRPPAAIGWLGMACGSMG